MAKGELALEINRLAATAKGEISGSEVLILFSAFRRLRRRDDACVKVLWHVLLLMVECLNFAHVRRFGAFGAAILRIC